MNAGVLLRSRKAIVAVVVVVVLAAALSLAYSSSRPASAANPTITISQTTDLANGQTVRIELSGFDPGPVYVHQCANSATSWVQCSEVTRVEGFADAQGQGSIDFPVWGGVIPRPDVVGFGNQALECVAGSCAIVVSECPFDILSTRTVARQIFLQQGGQQPPVPTSTSTSTTSTTSPSPGNITGPPITGLGSSQAQLAVQAWQNAAIADPYAVDVDYTPVNAPSGHEAFVSDSVDFALTTLPLSSAQIDQLAADNRGYTYVPVALSALSVAYRLKINGLPLRELQLSPDSIANLYRGGISFWNNPSISSDNEGCRLPGGGRYPVPSFRTDQSGANFTFSSWLDGAVPSLWELGGSAIIPIDDSQVFGEIGSDRLAGFIDKGIPDQTGPLPDRANNANAGRIGFIDQSIARERRLPQAAVRNAGGEYVVPTQASVEAAVGAATANADGVLIADYDNPDPAIYPMFTVTYALVPTTLTSTFTQEKADVLRTFLELALSTEGQAMATEAGFFELTAELRTQAAANLAKIPVAGATPPPAGPANVPPLDQLLNVPGIVPLASLVADAAFDAANSFDSSSGTSDDYSATTDVASDDGGGGDDGDDEGGLSGLLAGALAAASGVATLPVLLALGLLALAAGPLVRYYSKRRQA